MTARSEAKAVGLLAFRKAAWERQREESLLQSRRRLAAELVNISDPEQAAVQLAKPLSTRFAGGLLIKLVSKNMQIWNAIYLS